MAQDLAALDAALQILGTGVTGLSNSVQGIAQAVALLVEKINAGSSGVDLTQEVEAIQSMASIIADDAVKLKTAIDSAKPVTGS